ncbi:MAG TPA: formimidoylglutamate deiminase [Caulobacteraceae bacterium]|nr:formimidoylglutamate deiminase [Caulobacteraceae bacterium]
MSWLWFEAALLPSGWAERVRITCSGGRIAEVESGLAPQPSDERAAVGIPGIGNLHSHAFQRAMAGLTETRGPNGDDFWTWRELMYRFVDTLTPEDVEAIAAQAYAEMLETGFTRVGEFHYLHHGAGGEAYADPAEMALRIIAAASETGIGLTLLPTFYAHGGFGGLPLGARQARFALTLKSFAALQERAGAALAALPDGTCGVAAHSLRAVAPGELAELIALAPDTPFHIHIAEQSREVEDCLTWSGQRPVAWLLDHAPVDKRWCLVHATHVEADEADRLAATGAVVGLCPITEANLGDGLFPARGFPGAFGVGSDSNVLIDAAEELRLLEYGQRLQARARVVLGGGGSVGAALVAKAVAGGAQALGVTSGLAIGAPADIVSLDASHPALMEKRGDALLDGWIFAAGRTAVDRVWRGGIKVVEGGRHLKGEVIKARYRRTLGRLLAP